MTTLADANQLRQSSLQSRELRRYTADIVNQIGADIHAAFLAGLQHVLFKLPFVFDVDLPVRDCQRIVWSGVIEALARKHYTVKMHLSPDECQLDISWLSSEDCAIIEAQTRLIMSCCKN